MVIDDDVIWAIWLGMSPPLLIYTDGDLGLQGAKIHIDTIRVIYNGISGIFGASNVNLSCTASWWGVLISRALVLGRLRPAGPLSTLMSHEGIWIPWRQTVIIECFWIVHESWCHGSVSCRHQVKAVPCTGLYRLVSCFHNGWGRSWKRSEPLRKHTHMISHLINVAYIYLCYLVATRNVQLKPVVSRSTDTRTKGYPVFRFGTGREGGRRHLPREYLAKFFRSTY